VAEFWNPTGHGNICEPRWRPLSSWARRPGPTAQPPSSPPPHRAGGVELTWKSRWPHRNCRSRNWPRPDWLTSRSPSAWICHPARSVRTCTTSSPSSALAPALRCVTRSATASRSPP